MTKFKNRVLRIFGHMREEVVGDWQDCIMSSLITCKLHQILLGRMRWVGYVACMREMKDEKCVQNFGQKNLMRTGHSQDTGIDGRVILQWILGK
jgi:hypothetical protein